MFDKAIKVGFLTCAVASSVIGAQAQAQDKYGMIVIDRSGSMGIDRSDGTSRCDFANELAIEKAEKWFAPTSQEISPREYGKGGTHLEIRTFDVPGNLTSISAGYVTSLADAESYINSLSSTCPGASTALAEAACITMDDIAGVASVNSKEIFYISDAGENSSSPTSCISDSGDWTMDVYNHWFPYLGATPRLVINYTGLTRGNVSLLRANSNFEAEPDMQNNILSVSPNNQIMTSSQLWSTLAVLSGGEYVIEYDDGTVEVVVAEGGDNPW